MTNRDIRTMLEDWTNLFNSANVRHIADSNNYPAPYYIGSDAVVLHSARQAETAIRIFRRHLRSAGVARLKLGDVSVRHASETQCFAGVHWIYLGADDTPLKTTDMSYVLSRKSDSVSEPWRIDVTECAEPAFPDMPGCIRRALMD